MWKHASQIKLPLLLLNEGNNTRYQYCKQKHKFILWIPRVNKIGIAK